ncbi:hypothetical protein PBI_GRAYSON_284 [Rhodococcus phage Grayson]|nr:hypothetical protein PBI_GRAYSON_1 [Rhodococcus phage Grayson]AWN04612.1 hypothetical protein PBI_GRAYSON_284 [Rhodococcus phage Grayson]
MKNSPITFDHIDGSLRVMFTVNCNNHPWRSYDTRDEAIEVLRFIVRSVVSDDNYDELEFSANNGTLEYWEGEDKMIYTVREDKAELEEIKDMVDERPAY